MIKNSIKKLPIIVQISKDPLKVLALFEKIIVTCATISVIFFLMRKIEFTSSPLIGGVIAGTIGASIVFAKKMYYDQALSELIISSKTNPADIENHLHSIGYIKTESGNYTPTKSRLSIVFNCRSELIIIKKQNEFTTLTGPYDKIKSLFNVLTH